MMRRGSGRAMKVRHILGKYLWDVAVKVLVVPQAKKIGQKIAVELGAEGLEEIVQGVRREYPMQSEMAAVILAAVRAGGEEVLGIQNTTMN